MSNIDKRALRVLATALDGDDWHAEGNSVYGGRYDVGDNVCYDLITSCESVNGESHHADFIAAANPATVLALLDELEAIQKTSAARLGAIDTTHKMFQRERDRAEAAEKRIAEHRETLLAARSHVMQCARLGDAHANGVLQAIDRAAAEKGETS